MRDLEERWAQGAARKPLRKVERYLIYRGDANTAKLMPPEDY